MKKPKELDSAVRFAANQAQTTKSLYGLYILAWIYDESSLKVCYDHRDRYRRRLTSIAYLARYCELERQYFTERGVL